MDVAGSVELMIGEAEATIKFSVDRGMTCFGRFGVRQGMVPGGISLDHSGEAKNIIRYKSTKVVFIKNLSYFE